MSGKSRPAVLEPTRECHLLDEAGNRTHRFVRVVFVDEERARCSVLFPDGGQAWIDNDRLQPIGRIL